MTVRSLQHKGWAVLALLLSSLLWAESRFPKPDFEVTKHEMPTAVHPDPLSLFWEWLDVGLLALALGVAAFLVHRMRSRKGVFILMLLSVAYFGFYKKGCVCPVGSLQNVSLAIWESGYAIPASILFIFVLPLAAALLFGRVFCAAVCPLGAVQDAVVIKNPVSIPKPVREALGLIPYVYLALAVLLAATGASFVICRYDPFVAFFRLNGTGAMLITGGVFLVLGVFISRPYCRFFCPYGVLLNWFARFSWKRVTIAPGECVQCRLCETSCPFDAINEPVEAKLSERREKARARLKRFLWLLPVIVAVFAWLGSLMAEPLAKMHFRVRLADRVEALQKGVAEAKSDETEAFLGYGGKSEELIREATEIRSQMTIGAWLMGAFIGLVVAWRLIRLSIHRKQDDYEPHQGECFACARCFAYCPVKGEN